MSNNLADALTGYDIPDRTASRRRFVAGILDEIRRGDGIEAPPETWRDRAVGFLDCVLRKGADGIAARRLVTGFLTRMKARYVAFERSLWAWAASSRPGSCALHMGTVPFDDLFRLAEDLAALLPCDEDAERAAIREEGSAHA